MRISPDIESGDDLIDTMMEIPSTKEMIDKQCFIIILWKIVSEGCKDKPKTGNKYLQNIFNS